MALVDVRRLAAIDMHGVAGARLRRRLVLAEFSLGAGGAIALGLWAAIRAPGAGWRLFGAWIVGVGGSYVALALHGASLSRQAPWGRSWPASVSDPSSGGTPVCRSGLACRSCWRGRGSARFAIDRVLSARA